MGIYKSKSVAIIRTKIKNKETHYEKNKKISIVFGFRGFDYFASELQYAGEAL